MVCLPLVWPALCDSARWICDAFWQTCTTCNLLSCLKVKSFLADDIMDSGTATVKLFNECSQWCRHASHDQTCLHHSQQSLYNFTVAMPKFITSCSCERLAVCSSLLVACGRPFFACLQRPTRAKLKPQSANINLSVHQTECGACDTYSQRAC